MENKNNDGLVMKQIMEVIALARDDREGMAPLDPDMYQRLKSTPGKIALLKGYEQDLFAAGKMYRKVALSLMMCFGIDHPMAEPAPPKPAPEPKPEREPVSEPAPKPTKKGKAAADTPPKVRTRKVKSEGGFPQVPEGE